MSTIHDSDHIDNSVPRNKPDIITFYNMYDKMWRRCC